MWKQYDWIAHFPCMKIRFVPQEEIDIQLYDSCVHFATNGSIFGYHWFLNNTAREWDLLVEGDNYVSAMPLPRTKTWWGRNRLTHPRLVPELGVYSVKPLSPKRIQAFWDAVPDHFRSGKLTVEPASVPANSNRFEVQAASGSALFLNQPYEKITEDFPVQYASDLAKAQLANLRPAQRFKPEHLANFWLAQHGKSADNEWTYHAMQRLMYQVLHRGWGGTRAVESADGEMLAMSFIVYSHSRIFPLFTVESTGGKEVGALTYLWENLLQGHANQPLKIKREDLLGKLLM
jgi:hypothetical protein